MVVLQMTKKKRGAHHRGDGMLDPTKRHGQWHYVVSKCIKCQGKKTYHGLICDMCKGSGQILTIP